MSYDAALWGALACALTALGAVGSYAAWKRRGMAAGMRGIAWSILPVAAWLTGTLRLLTEVLGDVGHWAVRLVFSPTVWLGICLAGVAVVLFGASGLLRRRTASGSPSRREAPPSKPKRSVGPGRKDDLGLGEDLPTDDIEAILRKHGIR